MSVTLRELESGIDMTLKPKNKTILNNLGKNMYNEELLAPSKLKKKDYAATQPLNHDSSYTIIDSSIIDPSNNLFDNTPHHSQYIDDRMEYSAMGPYNSNRTIPAYNYVVGPSPAQRAINEAEQSHNIKMDQNGNKYIITPEGYPLFLPRQDAAITEINKQKQNINQYGAFSPYPGIAAGVPMLQNALASDQTIAMGENLHNREGFNTMKPVTCAEALRHVMHCPICRKYVNHDNKMYIVIIIVLVFIFSILLYMSMKA
jgi:hypothetical protein